VIGFHWVIDRPDSVSRVMPPTTTMQNTRKATASSQWAMATGRSARREGGSTMGGPCADARPISTRCSAAAVRWTGNKFGHGRINLG
jgi:hypothetical protein